MFGFFKHPLVLSVLATVLVVSTINVAFADEKPQTLGELMQKYVEAQNEITDTDRARRNFWLCRELLGPTGDCEQEYEAFIKALDQK